MNWTDWYTDTVDVNRVTARTEGNLTRHQREPVADGIPCRVYRSDSRAVGMTQTAAETRQEDRLACDVSVDIRPGDELIIHRGGRLGRPGPVIRAFASEPTLYYEPFGAILPGLAHQELRLLQQERVKG